MCILIKTLRLCYVFLIKIYGITTIPLIFGGGKCLNPEPCIYYALSIPTELSSRGPTISLISLLVTISY